MPAPKRRPFWHYPSTQQQPLRHTGRFGEIGPSDQRDRRRRESFSGVRVGFLER
jgi:hypothetical protein